MAQFEDLSDDILYLISQPLHLARSRTLRTIRLVSKRLKDFSESVLYRTISLQDDDDREAATYRFIERLSSPADNLSRYVRVLEIKNFKGDDDSCCMNTGLILACLNGLMKLDSFSWESNIILPAEILDTVHRRWPSAQLCATVKTLDQKLLRSSQLHRLSVSLPCVIADLQETMNLWRDLKNILLQCRALRALIIDVHPVHTEHQPSGGLDSSQTLSTDLTVPDLHADPSVAPPHNVSLSQKIIEIVQLPLVLGDKLPALECLEIRAKNYNLDLGHCSQLSQCIEFGRIKRLRLGPPFATSFCEILKDKVKQLDCLDFTYNYDYQHWAPSRSQRGALRACTAFIGSITALKEFIVRCDIVELNKPLWRVLAEVHGKCLRQFSILPHCLGHGGPQCRGDFRGLLSSLPGLTTLDLSLRACFQRGPVFQPGALQQPITDTNIENLPIIPRLKAIRLSIRVLSQEGRSLYSYVTVDARRALISLWENYVNASETCELETVDLECWRWEPSSPHPDENGQPRHVYINKVTFESFLLGEQLIVRPHGIHGASLEYHRNEYLEHRFAKYDHDGP